MDIYDKIYNISQRCKLDIKFYKNFIINKNQLQQKYSDIQSIYFHIIDNCNLLCANCSNYAPLVRHSWRDNIDNFNKLIKQLKIICPDLTYLVIGGGEPFLHPDIIKFCGVLRKYYPSSRIIINTNGLLLCNSDNINDKILPDLSILNVAIGISVYPILHDSDKNVIEKRCKKYKVIYHFMPREHFFNIQLDKEKVHNNSYRTCIWAGFDDFGNRKTFRCVQLSSNGNFYFCGITANIHLLNQYYNLKYELIENEDYINIYELKNNKELIEKYNNKIPFCSYCTPRNTDTNIREWKLSEKQMSEWIA